MTDQSLRWQDHEEKEAKDGGRRIAQEFLAAHAEARRSDPTRQDLLRRNLRSYSEREFQAAFGGNQNTHRTVETNSSRQRTISVNVVRNLCEAATSNLVGDRPIPMFIAEGGDFKQERHARLRERLVLAGFQKDAVHGKLTSYLVRNGTIFGDGFLRVVRDYIAKEIRIERVFTPDVTIDASEGFFGDPQRYYQRRSIERKTLANVFKDDKELSRQIMQAGGSGPADELEVVEGWSLPSRTGADDGRYCMAIAPDLVLAYDTHRHMAPPLVQWSWIQDPIGCYGTGIPAEIRGVQYEINVLAQTIQAHMWTGGGLKVLLEKGSSIVSAHINNDLRGSQIEYTGKKPEFWVQDVISGQFVNMLQFWIQQAYNLTGISQLNAQSQTPAATMSGRARLVHAHTESQRFLDTARRLATTVARDLALRYLEAAADLYEECGDVTMLYSGQRAIYPVKLSEVVRAEGSNDFDIQILSVAGLSKDAAARFEQIEEFRASGYYTFEQAKRLHDMPNTPAEDDRDRIERDVIEHRIEQILESKGARRPTPELNLALALKRSTQELNRLSMMANVPPQVEQQLRDWKSMVMSEIKKGTPRVPEVGSAPASEQAAIAA